MKLAIFVYQAIILSSCRTQYNYNHQNVNSNNLMHQYPNPQRDNRYYPRTRYSIQGRDEELSNMIVIPYPVPVLIFPISKVKKQTTTPKDSQSELLLRVQKEVQNSTEAAKITTATEIEVETTTTTTEIEAETTTATVIEEVQKSNETETAITATEIEEVQKSIETTTATEIEVQKSIEAETTTTTIENQEVQKSSEPTTTAQITNTDLGLKSSEEFNELVKANNNTSNNLNEVFSGDFLGQQRSPSTSMESVTPYNSLNNAINRYNGNPGRTSGRFDEYARFEFQHTEGTPIRLRPTIARIMEPRNHKMLEYGTKL